MRKSQKNNENILSIGYTPSFIRAYKICEPALQSEIKEKIKLFENKENHNQLKVHKLKGRLGDKYAFSVNYKYRIIFEFGKGNLVYLLHIGTHDQLYR